MSRTSLGSKSTGSDGQAQWSYTGTGAGRVGFVAVYDEKESNIVIVDDYTQRVDNVTLSASASSITYGQPVTFTANVKDQHNENITSGTVTFKENGTSIGTGNIRNGVATFTQNYFNAGSHNITAEISGVVSNNVSVNVGKRDTTLTIVPPTVTYLDEFDVSGTLSSGSGLGMTDFSVVLHWKEDDGAEQTVSVNTTEGAYHFYRPAPTSIHNYKFWVTFEGTSDYNGSSSSEVSVDVNKRSTILNVTSGTTVTVSGANFLVEGTLFDKDYEPMEGAEIEVTQYVASVPTTVTIATATVDENGDWSCQVPTTYMDDGDNTITVQYAGNSRYTNAVQSVTVRKVSFDDMSISLTAGSQILSYADEQSTPNSQYATVTAQLLNGQSSALISNVPVVFGAYLDDVLITGSEQTVHTDSNGQASYTYHSAGVGDVIVKAVPDNRTLLTKTYSIEDCWKYDSTVYEGSSSTPIFNVNYDLPSNYALTYEDYYTTTGTNSRTYLNFGVDDTHRIAIGTIESDTYDVLVQNNQSWSAKTVISTNQRLTTTNWIEHTLTVENGVVTFKNATTSNTSQIDLTLLRAMVIRTNAKIRNIKVKPL